MIDTVFSLDAFLNVLGSEGGNKADVRICVKHDSVGEHFVRCQVIVSAGIYDLVTGRPRKVLRCIVAQRTFNHHFLTVDWETEDKKKYQEWVKEAYGKVEEKLGFKPVEGFWRWNDEK